MFDISFWGSPLWTGNICGWKKHNPPRHLSTTRCAPSKTANQQLIKWRGCRLGLSFCLSSQHMSRLIRQELRSWWPGHCLLHFEEQNGNQSWGLKHLTPWKTNIEPAKITPLKKGTPFSKPSFWGSILGSICWNCPIQSQYSTAVWVDTLTKDIYIAYNYKPILVLDIRTFLQLRVSKHIGR